jgi:hypothetical protein
MVTFNNKNMYREEAQELFTTIQHYFDGIFYGDWEKLQSVFHPRSLLFGDIKGQPYLKNLDEYIEAVRNRKSPSSLGESFRMKIISIEILNHAAYAKLHCPMLGYNYYDHIALNKIEGKWLIVNKLFTHCD